VLVNRGRRATNTDAFLRDGGRVLNIGFQAPELEKLGIASEPRSLLRPVPEGELARFCPRHLLYWRGELPFAAILEKGAATQGLWYRRGDECFLQTDPEVFTKSPPYATNEAARANASISVKHLEKLVALARTHIGEVPSDALRRELCSTIHKPGFETLGTWHVIGPYWVDPALNATNRLAVAHPCEAAALSGDLNPNFTYPNSHGLNLDFRRQVQARYDGYVDFRDAFKGRTDETSVGYAVKIVHSDDARDAVLRLGFDWYLKVYVNGKLAADYSTGLGCNPTPNIKRCVVRLKKGDNVLCLKLRSGSSGFGFWANISEPDLRIDADATVKETPSSLYPPGHGRSGEYWYNYW
jgi:beta-galactosidase